MTCIQKVPAHETDAVRILNRSPVYKELWFLVCRILLLGLGQSRCFGFVLVA